MSQFVQPRGRIPAKLSLRQSDRRAHERHTLCLPGRITWRDTDGTRRTARIRTRDVSLRGVFVECMSGCGAIPRYRLVDLKLDGAARLRDDLPAPLRQPRVPAAVYRVGPQRRSTGLPDGFALRLLVKPDRLRKKASPTTAESE